MGKDELFHFSEDLDGIGAGFDKQLKQGENEKLSQSLKKARVLCIRERFDEALKIYESIVDEDIECVAGYIGILRVHSKDYTVFDGAEIEKDIKVIDKIGDGTEADDDEYVDYLKKRKEYLSKKTAVPVAPAKPAPGAPAAPENPAPIETAKPTLPDGILSKEETNRLYKAKEYKKAFPSMLYYAEQGDAEICVNVAVMYALGSYYYPDTVQKDEKKAAYFYTKAAEQGNIYGQWSLGKCYRDGEGVNVDIDKAIELLEKASAQGAKGAMVELGDIYREKRDKEKAIYWYEKAAADGWEYALKKLKSIKK